MTEVMMLYCQILVVFVAINAPTTKRVRELAPGAGDCFGLCHDRLVRYGAAAFPAYEAILSDLKSDPDEIAGVLGALIDVKAPKGQFLITAVPLLAHKDSGVRLTAVGFF